MQCPGAFLRHINETVSIFCTAYIDDILIYSETEEEHTEHVLKVLRRLEEQNRISSSIYLDLEKAAAIWEWQTSKPVKDVQAFTDFTAVLSLDAQSALAANNSSLGQEGEA
jgi:hypothetical protein